MKLIYVTIPVVVKDSKKAYVVKDEADLYYQIMQDEKAFEKEVWFSKPEKTKDGKELKFHEMSENW